MSPASSSPKNTSFSFLPLLGAGPVPLHCYRSEEILVQCSASSWTSARPSTAGPLQLHFSAVCESERRASSRAFQPISAPLLADEVGGGHPPQEDFLVAQFHTGRGFLPKLRLQSEDCFPALVRSSDAHAPCNRAVSPAWRSPTRHNHRRRPLARIRRSHSKSLVHACVLGLGATQILRRGGLRDRDRSRHNRLVLYRHPSSETSQASRLHGLSATAIPHLAFARKWVEPFCTDCKPPTHAGTSNLDSLAFIHLLLSV